jgi:hypothetical protein
LLQVFEVSFFEIYRFQCYKLRYKRPVFCLPENYPESFSLGQTFAAFSTNNTKCPDNDQGMEERLKRAMDDSQNTMWPFYVLFALIIVLLLVNLGVNIYFSRKTLAKRSRDIRMFREEMFSTNRAPAQENVLPSNSFRTDPFQVSSPHDSTPLASQIPLSSVPNVLRSNESPRVTLNVNARSPSAHFYSNFSDDEDGFVEENLNETEV